MNETNGMYVPREEWEAHKKVADETLSKVRDVHLAYKHDSESLKLIAETLQSLSAQVMDVLLGKKVISEDTMRDLLKEQRENNMKLVKALCWAFGTIIIVTFGLKSLAPHLLE